MTCTLSLLSVLVLLLALAAPVAFAHASGNVSRVVPGGAAEQAGLRAGDRLLKLDGRALETADDLQQVVAAHEPGDVVAMEVERDGERLTLHLTFGTKPDGGPSMGVALALAPAGAGGGEPMAHQPVARQGGDGGDVAGSFSRDECRRWLDDTYRLSALATELGLELPRDVESLRACVAQDVTRMVEPIPRGWCDNVMKVHCSGAELVTEIGEALADRCVDTVRRATPEAFDGHPERQRCLRDQAYDHYFKQGVSLDAEGCRKVYAEACAQDQAWLQWGGPEQTFRAPAGRLAASWPAEGPRVLWRESLGEGYSAILYRDGRLFTSAQRDADEAVVSLDAATGKLLWERRYPTPPYLGQRGYGAGPRSTPALAGDRLFAAGISGTFLALDAASGEILWRRELWGEGFDGNRLSHGYSSSPLAWGDIVVAAVGGSAGGLVAFDQATGEVRWRSAPFRNSYSSPMLARVAGETQLLAFMAEELVGLDPRDGKLLWRYPHTNQWNHNVSLPLVVGDDTIFLSSPEAGARGIRLHREGDGFRVEELWLNRRVQLYHGSSVLEGGYVYASSGLASPAFLVAVDTATGEIAWRERGFGKANCLEADGRLLILDENGKLALATVTPERLLVASETQLFAERSWTVPTVVGQRLYARSAREVVAVDLG